MCGRFLRGSSEVDGGRGTSHAHVAVGRLLCSGAGCDEGMAPRAESVPAASGGLCGSGWRAPGLWCGGEGLLLRGFEAVDVAGGVAQDDDAGGDGGAGGEGSGGGELEEFLAGLEV